MLGQLLSWTGLKLTWGMMELQDLHLQTPQPKVQPQKLLPRLIALINGLKMVIVMMKTTMLLANLMVEIVVLTLWKIGICTAVNVPVYLAMPQLVRLEYLTGLEMTSVMMKTIMLCVDSMAEIAVHHMHIQIGIGIAMIVNA